MTEQTYDNSSRHTLAWLIPLALVAGLLIYYATRGTESPAPASTQQDTQQEVAQQPINSVSDVTGSTDTASLQGRSAGFEEITIRQVIGQRVFSIGDIGGKPLYIIITGSAGQDGDITLKEGQKVSISGTLVSTQGAQVESLNLTKAESDALANQDVVLVVSDIQVTPESLETESKTPADTQPKP